MAEKSTNFEFRVLLFTTAYKPLVGGSEIAIEQIARRLPDIYFDIVTPRLKTGLAWTEFSGNVRIYRIGIGWPLDKWLFPVTGFLKAVWLSRKQTYSVIHAYQASYAAGAAWLANLFFPAIPFLLTLQEGKDLGRQNFFVRFFRKLIILRADSATVISEYLWRYITGVRESIPVRRIPNGVDGELFSNRLSPGARAAFRARLGIGPDAHVVVSASRMVEKNGLDNLIRAFALVNAEHPAVLLLAGDGPLRHQLTRLVEQLGIREQVVFAGSVRYQNLPEYLAASDVFVRPSLSEGLGNAFLEAMAAGLPVIGSPVGGIVDFLRDGQTGLFCDPSDPADIALKMNTVLKDPELRQRLIDGGQAVVLRHYSWDSVARDMGDVYNGLSTIQIHE